MNQNDNTNFPNSNMDSAQPEPTKPTVSSIPLQTPSADEKAFVSEYVALSRDGVLVKPGNIAVRCFSTMTGSTILAYMFGELNDSFIIGFPATIMSIEDNVLAKLISPVPMVRLFKNHLTMLSMPSPKLLLCYLMATKNQVKLMPGYFDKERVLQLDAIIKTLQSDMKISEIKPSSVLPKTMKHLDMKNIKSVGEALSEAIKSKVTINDINMNDFGIKPKKIKYKH